MPFRNLMINVLVEVSPPGAGHAAEVAAPRPAAPGAAWAAKGRTHPSAGLLGAKDSFSGAFAALGAFASAKGSRSTRAVARVKGAVALAQTTLEEENETLSRRLNMPRAGAS